MNRHIVPQNYHADEFSDHAALEVLDLSNQSEFPVIADQLPYAALGQRVKLSQSHI